MNPRAYCVHSLLSLLQFGTLTPKIVMFSMDIGEAPSDPTKDEEGGEEVRVILKLIKAQKVQIYFRPRTTSWRT